MENPYSVSYAIQFRDSVKLFGVSNISSVIWVVSTLEFF